MNIRNLLVEALWSFSYKDLGRFDKFLRSPYFKKEHSNSAKVYELFKMLKSYFQKLSPSFHIAAAPKEPNGAGKPVRGNGKGVKTGTIHLPVVNWENAEKKLFPEITCIELKQKRMGKLCSEFISYILEFFAVENFRRGGVDSQISLSYEILKRNLSGLFEHCWKVKYFNGTYNEDEVTNVFHRYHLIRIYDLHREKCNNTYLHYDTELMLIKKYYKEVKSEITERKNKQFIVN
jgi:hypothetical protein